MSEYAFRVPRAPKLVPSSEFEDGALFDIEEPVEKAPETEQPPRRGVSGIAQAALEQASHPGSEPFTDARMAAANDRNEPESEQRSRPGAPIIPQMETRYTQSGFPISNVPGPVVIVPARKKQ